MTGLTSQSDRTRSIAAIVREARVAPRLTGVAVLLVLLVAHLGIGDGADVSWRRAWFDFLQRMEPRERVSQPAVVVLIDDRAIERHGQWPWPRDLMALLVWKLSEHQPAAIGFDIIFADRDRSSPHVFASGLEDFYPDLAQQLREMPDNDEMFREQILDHPVVLPVAGAVRRPAGTCPPPADWADVQEVAPGGQTDLLSGLDCHYDFVAPLPEFGAAAHGLAAISFESRPDGVVRRVPALQQYGAHLHALLGIESMRVGSGAGRTMVAPGAAGVEVSVGDWRFPAESDGGFWVRFGRFDSGRYISAADVLGDDERAAEMLAALRNKVVLVGVGATGTWDRQLSPLGEEIPGVEVHMQTIEQIWDGVFLRRPAAFYRLETALMLIAGLVLIWLLPRLHPVSGTLAAGGVVVALIAGGWLLFRAGLLVDMASPAIGAVATAVLVQAVNLIEAERARLKGNVALAEERATRARERLVSELELASARERGARLQGELEAAGRIQKGLLPATRKVIDGKVDLACFIHPARQVGGDFYDHFMVDDRRLYFSVCDVSGKGADASLFMAVSKSLWKSVALRQRTPLEKIQVEANNEITRDNAETMFVTGLCGLLDTATLELSYSSAGHDSPLVFGAGRPPEQLAEFAGPPAGLVDGIDYPVGNVRLGPGDRLCVFTDGVTEAMNEEGELFGIERLVEAVSRIPDAADSPAAVEHVVAEVRAFAGNAEQSDDLTLMVLTIPGEAVSEPG